MSTTPSNTAIELSPPYLPFATFQSAVENLRTHGVPDPIDRTTWDSRSGSDQVQIAGAFKFLGLVGDGNHPTQELRALVDATAKTDPEKTILRGLINNRYTNVFERLNLKTATPGQLEEAIGFYGVSGATRDRAVRFFLKAADYCGITLSTRLTRNLRVRGTPVAEGSSPENGNGSEPGATPAAPSARPRRRRRAVAVTSALAAPGDSEAPLGSAMKTVSLPNVRGTLTISGTFNAFGLSGDERKLVYDIIDMMDAFEKAKASE